MILAMVGPYPVNPRLIQNGVEAVVVYLVEGLKNIRGLDIHVVSCTPEVQTSLRRSDDGVMIHFVPSARRFGNITFGVVNKYRTLRTLKLLMPDIIHVHTPVSYPFIGISPFVPTITTVHGIVYREDMYKNEGLDWLRRRARIRLEKMALKRTRDLICVTEYVKEMVRPFTSGTAYVLENPVATKFFTLESAEIGERILFAGGIRRRKNLLSLLDAVRIVKSRIPTVTLVIVGPVEEKLYYDVMQAYIRNHDLVDNVCYLGQISEDEILSEYRRCSIVASSSLEESAGMVLQQAMAAGKAVVASQIEGFSHIVKDGRTGFLVDPDDPERFADKIYRLLTDRELRLQFGKAGKEEAIRRFSPERIAEKTLQLYQRILNEAKIANCLDGKSEKEACSK